MSSPELLYKVAFMYYEENMTQSEIARMLGISRPKVSRLLKKAREEGIVRIELRFPERKSPGFLSEELKEFFELEDAIVAEVNSENETDILEAISKAGARYIEKKLEDGSIVGVGWGKTVYHTVNEILPVKKLSSSVFVPLIGGTGRSERFYQINSIVEKLSGKFGAKHLYLNAPAFFDDRETLELFTMERRIFEVIETWKHLDVAIFGLGKPIQDSEILKAEIDPFLVIELLRQKAVGDILARFFKPNGDPCRAKLNELILGVSLEELLNVPVRICLCGGLKKVDGIKAAAFKRYFNVLITDSKTADLILKGLKGGNVY